MAGKMYGYGTYADMGPQQQYESWRGSGGTLGFQNIGTIAQTDPYQNWYANQQRTQATADQLEAGRRGTSAFEFNQSQTGAQNDLARQLQMISAQQASQREKTAADERMFGANLGWQKESQQGSLAAALEQIRLKEAMEEQMFGTRLAGVKGLQGDIWDRISPLLGNLGFQAGSQPGEVTGFATPGTGAINLNEADMRPLDVAYQQDLRQIRAPGRSGFRTRAAGQAQEARSRGLATALSAKQRLGGEMALGARGQNIGLVQSLMQMLQPNIGV